MLLLIFAAIQAVQAPPPAPRVRGDRFQVIVPQGWRTLNDGGVVFLGHSSGAALPVERIDRTTNLCAAAQRQAEGGIVPLRLPSNGGTRSFIHAHHSVV